ncbi:MAG: cbb3-type cytochrome oxidase assembly protein CcoS [Balneolales bacterium]|nr:cbb3-type cytochrome oxidase assembly protein CcoS [Balneolales bacterium]
MGVIVLLILFSLLVALIFLGAFFWAVKSGQFDDPQTPAIRMLFDNEISTSKNKSKTLRGE